jgi:predicted nucleic acid-binding protein
VTSQTSVTADSSVLLAALADWHDAHQVAFAAVEHVERIAAHAFLETVSVLSRLPAGLAIPLADAAAITRELAAGELLTLSAAGYRDLVDALAAAELGGGTVYDGLIGATAKEHGSVLLSLDKRAARSYAAVGADYELLT